MSGPDFNAPADLATRSRNDEPSFAEGVARLVRFWDWFWFTPTRPHTLCVLRVCTGAMLLYCHLVLASDLFSFVGDTAWTNNQLARELHDGAFGESDWARSYLWNIESKSLLLTHHSLTMVVTACYCLGLGTRVMVPLALFLQLMYIHRLTGALFGLDQIVTYVTMYLAFAPCGARFSLDAIIRKRIGVTDESSRWLRFMLPDDRPSIAANIGTRLLQLHLCVIYLFGGLAKARGETWWNGTAVWIALANYEYQSVDMTWASRFPALISAMSNVTLFWEVFYCALIWPRVTRPFVIAMALLVHASIAVCLGMMTFGTMMIVANGVFLSPALFQSKRQRDRDDEESLQDSEMAREAMDVEDAEREVDRQLRNPDLSESEREKLRAKKQKIREAAARVKRRYRALKKREAKYEVRVKKLREREDKLKAIVAKRRRRRDDEEDTSESE
ncbi:MAG: HTTM domain-containing protein [Planctomycetota bacterium]